MKVLFKNTTSLFLAFLVLFSTMSFTIEMHYCGGALVDTAIFKQAKTCGMEMHQSNISSENVTLKKECCKNDYIVKEGQNELQTSINLLSFDQQLFVTSFIYSYLNLFEVKEKITPFRYFSPPLFDKDIQVLYQTFLI